VALISTNLAVLNLLPILPLDGGHLLFVAIEAIRKKPVEDKYKGWVAMTGLAAILLLFVVVTYKDVLRFDVLGHLKNLL
jgi:regulator of sigma E protease